MDSKHPEWLIILVTLVIVLLTPATLRAAILTYDVRGEFSTGNLAGQDLAVFFTYGTESIDPFPGSAPVQTVGIAVPGLLDVTTGDFTTIERSRLGTFADTFVFLEFGGDFEGGFLGMGVNLGFTQLVDLSAGLPLNALSFTEVFLNVLLEHGTFSGVFTSEDPTSVTLRTPTAVPGPNTAMLLVIGLVLRLVARGRRRGRYTSSP